MIRSGRRPLTLVLAVIVALSQLTPALAGPFDQAPRPAFLDPHGIKIADMDPSVDPADDFYRYANGGWIDRTEYPPDSASIDVGYELTVQSENVQIDRLERDIEGGKLTRGSDEWTVAQIFAQGTDMAARNADGLDPISDELAAIEAIDDLPSLSRYLAEHPLDGADGFFTTFVTADEFRNTTNAVYLYGPVLGMPDPSYYVDETHEAQSVRKAYTAANAKFLELLGESSSDAALNARNVFRLERSLAGLGNNGGDFDASQYDQTVDTDDLSGYIDSVDWADYFAALGISSVDHVIVGNLDYFKALDHAYEHASIATVKELLKLQLMWSAAPFLDTETYDIYFSFMGSGLWGMDEPPALDVRVLNTINDYMGDTMGQLYVEEVFTPEAKADVTELVENVIAAYRERLADNPWMEPSTKQAALRKLDKVGLKVGYPETWETYSAIKVGSTYFDSIQGADIATERTQNETAGEPVDRGEWSINAQEVNAYYDPYLNEIVFPAAILQPPFFDPLADPASNYGALGYVIGHEITHGFDDYGSQFDANGDYADWWTSSDRATYLGLQNRLVDQYDAISPIPGLSLDGNLELGENIADLGGIQNAYAALQRELGQHGDPGKIDGLSQDQRFFIAAAQVWHERIRDEALAAQIEFDPHAPGSVRGVQPLRNCDAFYTAFDIEPGDPMYLPPSERIEIW